MKRHRLLVSHLLFPSLSVFSVFTSNFSFFLQFFCALATFSASIFPCFPFLLFLLYFHFSFPFIFFFTFAFFLSTFISPFSAFSSLSMYVQFLVHGKPQWVWVASWHWKIRCDVVSRRCSNDLLFLSWPRLWRHSVCNENCLWYFSCRVLSELKW